MVLCKGNAHEYDLVTSVSFNSLCLYFEHSADTTSVVLSCFVMLKNDVSDADELIIKWKW